jgi:hypothetical protein
MGALAFSHEGRHLVAGGTDATVRIWPTPAVIDQGVGGDWRVLRRWLQQASSATIRDRDSHQDP